MKQQDTITNTERMIGWLRANRDKHPARFVLMDGVEVLDSKKMIDRLISELESYKENKSFGNAFRAAYFRAYRIKKLQLCSS